MMPSQARSKKPSVKGITAASSPQDSSWGPLGLPRTKW